MSSAVAPRRQDQHAILLALILIVYVVLSVVYNVAQPILEAPEEAAHVEYVRYVQLHHALPTGPVNAFSETPPAAPGTEFSQVPLYYLTLALLLSPIAQSSNTDWHRNPYVTWAGHPHRHAVALHRVDEGWPYRGPALFVHAGRLVSMLFGMVVLLATHALGVAVIQHRPLALFTTAWLALSPGFLLASSRVNNDAAAMGWGALTLLLCGRFLVSPRTVPTRGLLILSLALCGAVLSKLHLVFLVPLVFVTAVLVPGVGRPWWMSGARGFAVLTLPLSALGGWWYFSGHTFSTQVGEQAGLKVVRVWSALFEIEWTRIPAALWTLHSTWWGSVGFSHDIVWPWPVYVVLLVPMLLLTGFGLTSLFGPRRWPTECHRAQRAMTLLSLATVPLFYATIVRYLLPSVSLDVNARFILPAAPVVALVITLGGRHLSLGRLRRPAALAYLTGMFALAVATPLLLVPRINAPTIPARLAEDPEMAAPALAAFANGADVFAIPDLPSRLQPGEPMRISLRWRVRTPPREDFTGFIHLVDYSGERVVQYDAVPLDATFPPRYWQQGELIDEERQLSVPNELRPGVYSLRLGAYRLERGELIPIPLNDSNGATSTAAIGSWRVLPDASEAVFAHPAEALFGQSLVLRSYTMREDLSGLRVRLFWEARELIAQNLVVSVQLLDEQGRLIAQHDSEPVEGRLPTSAWGAGELVCDDHRVPWLDRPRGSRAIAIVYDRETGLRLPVSVAGYPPADHFVLAE